MAVNTFNDYRDIADYSDPNVSILNPTGKKKPEVEEQRPAGTAAKYELGFPTMEGPYGPTADIAGGVKNMLHIIGMPEKQAPADIGATSKTVTNPTPSRPATAAVEKTQPAVAAAAPVTPADQALLQHGKTDKNSVPGMSAINLGEEYGGQISMQTAAGQKQITDMAGAAYGSAKDNMQAILTADKPYAIATPSGGGTGVVKGQAANSYDITQNLIGPTAAQSLAAERAQLLKSAQATGATIDSVANNGDTVFFKQPQKQPQNPSIDMISSPLPSASAQQNRAPQYLYMDIGGTGNTQMAANKDAFQAKYGFVPLDYESKPGVYEAMMMKQAPDIAKNQAETAKNATANALNIAHANYYNAEAGRSRQSFSPEALANQAKQQQAKDAKEQAKADQQRLDKAEEVTRNMLENHFGVAATPQAMKAYKSWQAKFEPWQQSVNRSVNAFAKANPDQASIVQDAIVSFHSKAVPEKDKLAKIESAKKLLTGDGNAALPAWFNTALNMPVFNTANLQPSRFNKNDTTIQAN